MWLLGSVIRTVDCPNYRLSALSIVRTIGYPNCRLSELSLVPISSDNPRSTVLQIMLRYFAVSYVVSVLRYFTIYVFRAQESELAIARETLRRLSL